MGFYLSRMTEALTGWVTPSEILILSLDNAGKTTTLYKLKMGDDAPVPIPTILSNIEETLTPVKGVTFTFLDVGGVKAIRQLWIRQHKDCSGILFVVDSADRTRLEESREELQQVCGVLEMKGVPVVVLANKQDLPSAAGIRAQDFRTIRIRSPSPYPVSCRARLSLYWVIGASLCVFTVLCCICHSLGVGRSQAPVFTP